MNLYACRNLNTAPEFQFSIPDIYRMNRANVGFKKVEWVTNKKGRVVAIRILELDEGSAAARAKIRPGTVGDIKVRRGGGGKKK